MDFQQQNPQAVAETEQKTWAMLAHLSTLLGFTGIPFANIIAPLVVWMMKRDTMPLVDDQAKEALNFQITLMIYGVVCGLLVLVFVGIFLLAALVVFDVAFTVVAALKAQQGMAYRYPMTIRLI